MTRDDLLHFTKPVVRRAMDRDWRVLCERIGERRAGTPAETQAAEFIAREFRAAGLGDVVLESFPCTSVRQASAEVQVRDGRQWRQVEAEPMVGAPATPGQTPIEGDLVWLELPEQTRRLGPGSLRGRILAWFGPMPTEVKMHRRLLAARPAAVIHIDERLPFRWPKNDGVYPYWSDRYGMPPMLTVPYAEAWRWRRDGLRRVRVRVVAEQVVCDSHNVIAELRGAEPELPAIVLSAHHDTQRNNPGADDNASGVICLLALARNLAAHRETWKRTLRFISFGTEEQLSVGANAYVRRHRTSAANTGLVLNFDSVASPLGHFVLSVAGGDTLARFAERQLVLRDLAVQVVQEVTPFADQFPFNRAGVPSLLFSRTNFPGGRWQHHSRYDTLENVSVDAVRRLLHAARPLVAVLATQRAWPFLSALPPDQQRTAHRFGRELFGG